MDQYTIKVWFPLVKTDIMERKGYACNSNWNMFTNRNSRCSALLISRHYCTRVDLVHCSSLDTIVHVSILSFPCSVWYIVVCPFVLFSLSVLRFTDSDYPFCICKPFLPERKMLHLFVDYNWRCTLFSGFDKTLKMIYSHEGGVIVF
jgi:hypothetical protein